MILYHVTTKKNAKKIKTNGFKPQLGKNARACNEPKPAIWFFPDEITMMDALGGWFEDLCEDKMYCIKVNVPDSYVNDSTVDYEKVIYRQVDPKYIEKIYQIW